MGYKARFDDVYDRPDPRAYFRALHPLDYQTPRHGQRVFQTLLEARRATHPQHAATVLDLCCSYGVNAALLNYDLRLEDLYARYLSPELASYSSRELAALDRGFFAARVLPGAAPLVGVDVAGDAVSYALAVGLLDRGFAENLETAGPSPTLRTSLAKLALITVTGGIGYISQPTFRAVLECTSTVPWVAAFCLRTVSYEPIAEVLSCYGMVTEKLTGRTFPQRRFASDAERQHALDGLARAGVDPSGKEACGYYHTELFVSRPARDVVRVPLERLLDGAM
ncbi:MAG: hypothetical protein M3133_05215 [Actinomycetota bacterium]|nr:hypothetical protein [Actinomycetota bacterium]